jgi:hypothetical protein
MCVFDPFYAQYQAPGTRTSRAPPALVAFKQTDTLRQPARTRAVSISAVFAFEVLNRIFRIVRKFKITAR